MPLNITRPRALFSLLLLILKLSLFAPTTAAFGQQQLRQRFNQAQTPREPLAEFIAQQGGLVKNLTLTKSLNPILIRRDIIIKRDSKLTIESGAELYFEHQRGIIVQGTLEILGQFNDKVKLQLLRTAPPQSTSAQAQSLNRQVFANRRDQPKKRPTPSVRLVDGDLPSEGRVQIKLNDKWHSLCTNSKNLTAADLGVLCRQAGFQAAAAHFYKWFPRRNNETTSNTFHLTPGVMSKSFHCSGNESSLQQCQRWNRLRVGGGVCDNQSDIGVRCSKKLADEIGGQLFWRGIEFQESETQQEYTLEGQMKQRVSKSLLHHLIISEAGLDELGNVTAALRVYGQPPRIDHLQIANSLYGIMVHECQDAIKFSNIKLINNFNSPLFINTSHGKVHLDGLHAESNGGDALRLVRHERPLVGSHDFCKFANLGTDQTYPVILSHEQQFLRSGRECCQEFISQQQQLTVHFPLLRSIPNNLLPETGPATGDDSNNGRRLVSVPAGVQLGHDAQLTIYDDYRDEAPFKLTIQNQTRAQSIVSKVGRLKICYEPASYRTVLFTIEIVADVINGQSPIDYEYGTGIAHDLELSNGHLANNEGRGLWLDNLRSGLRMINTTVIGHNYLSGLHVENGTGEVIIQASRLLNNTGHGVYIQQAGGYYHFDNLTISDNSARGISIEYDKRPELIAFNHTFHLGYSLLANNGDNALFLGNVCRSDAFWNISMNSFIENADDAIHFQSCSATHQNVHHFHLMTSRLNTRNSNSLESISPIQLAQASNKLQELYITHNIFLGNQRRAIRLAPVYFVKSYIRHNLFRNHPLAVLYINNQAAGLSTAIDDTDDPTTNSTHLAPVNIRVASNRFYANRGRYVANLGLHEDGTRQQLVFTKNHLEQNIIAEPYGELRPRSRCSAVVVVSSSQVKVVRNRFDNPQSSYELGVHLEAHAKIINATANYWGRQLEASAIYRRIFDRKNRYNLAQVEFLQYLLSPEDLEYITDLSFERERDKITTFRNGSRLGGEVKGYEELAAGVYTVLDDITILPGSHLVIRDGATLKFGDGVGLMNQGRLDALGKANSRIQFTSMSMTNLLPLRSGLVASSTTPPPLASAWVSRNQVFDESESLVMMNKSNEFQQSRRPRQSNTANDFYNSAAMYQAGGSGQNVRLSHATMGKLEVQIDGVWGSVCEHNFDIHDAAIACQQLGMILNKDDWLLEPFQFVNAAEVAHELGESTPLRTIAPALMTNVRCDPTLDTDLTRCRAEVSLRGDFDGICNSEVGIRCFPSSWSGVRFGMGAETSTLEHVTIQRAGMFDYAKYLLKPALQIDFNRHWLNWLVVKSNSDSGLGIMFNDVIGRHFSELAVNDGKFINNERHGIELHARGLTVRGCHLENNRQNGLDYNPTMSQSELDDLLSWLKTPKNANSVVTLNFPLQSSTFEVPSSEDSYRFFVLPKHPPVGLSQTFTISTDPGHMLSIQLISPIRWDSTERLNMSLSLNPDGSTMVWDLRVNLTSLPMISPSYKFHLNYTSGARPYGNVVLYVRSRYNNRDLKVLTKFIPHHLIMPKFDQTATNINSRLINSLVVVNNTISRNGIGLKFRYPNHAHGPGRQVYNWRYSNETTNITQNVFEGNSFSSLFVSSDEQENELESSIETASSEIRYNVLNNKMRRNKDGIRQFSRDIRYSHNVFHWSINETNFEMNKGGGINLLLPYYWRYDSNQSHTIELYNNSFVRNTQFELSVEGHFGAISMELNKFRENRCRNRLIGFGGMEKQVSFRHNQIEFNICNRLVDFNIHSHADKLGLIASHFEFNSLRFNRRLISNVTLASLASNFRFPRLLDRLHPMATDYALGLRGVQALNISRNLFVNSELRFDLVVAISMDPDERTVNAVENYWGSSRVRDINARIFDFDDWNSYAMVEFSPFLVSDSFQSASMLVATIENSPPSSSQWSAGGATLGGRLMRSMTLQGRKEPYLVESDLTVMPNVRLTIERGATLMFMPNVGVLVLGELIAAGTRDKPIIMRPLLSGSDLLPLSSYLYPAKVRPNITQVGLGDALAHEHNYAFKHYQFTYPVDMGNVRLCKNEICHDGAHVYENNVEDPQLRREVLASYALDLENAAWRLDGFLEVFNMTTLQWVPVCDPLFTKHAARVVCRQLGYSHLTLLRRGRRYTIEQEQVSSVKSWPRSVQCEGDESDLSSCPLSATAFMNHSTRCQHDTNQFVYVFCQDFLEVDTQLPGSGVTFDQLVSTTNLPKSPDGNNLLQRPRASSEHSNHWAGIRFSCPAAATTTTTNNNAPMTAGKSRLHFVSLDRAGLLHRRPAPAVQVLQCNVQMEHVAISNSASHGLELVAPQATSNLHQLHVVNSVGLGVNYLSLTGSSSATRQVPYLPLKQVDLNGDIFGLVDVCGANKEVRIDERALLVFRYQSRPVDCVKIVRSRLNVKHLGIRMLQFNLFNSTHFTPRPDSIRIYDGSLFDWDSRLLVELGVEERHRLERPELKFYQTSDSTMTVRVHASGAGPMHGFIAELVTTPVSYNIQRDLYINMTYSELNNNKLGALAVANAGESTPNFILKNNRFEGNCLHLFGNFTSCVSAVHMELQNCQHLRAINNLFKANQAGGLMVKSYSHSAVASLDAQLERNVFESNQNTWALALIGPKTDPYQRVSVLNNFLTRNKARYLPNVLISRVVANFSGNIVTSNVGKHQIEAIGFDKLPLTYQMISNNYIYNNTATYERDQSTIVSNSAGQQLHLNYLVNPDNHFELSTRNWSRYDVRPLQVPRDDEIIHLVAGDGSSKELLRKNVDSIPLSVIDAKRLDLHQATVQAELNWWGFNTTGAIQGRVRDRLQHGELIRVQFTPFLESNRTILDGVCSGGWQRVNEACLVYIGTRMTYREAREFCEGEHATLPLLRGHLFSGNHYEFTDFVASQHETIGSSSLGPSPFVGRRVRGNAFGGSELLAEDEFDAQIERIWVRSFDVSRDSCPALNDYRTKNFDCQDKYAFLCEKDPQVVVTLGHWYRESGGVLAVFLCLITLLLTCCCSACWLYKSRERHREKLVRKNSLHASMRSLNRMGYQAPVQSLAFANQNQSSSNNSLSEFFLHRQLYQTDKSSITDLSMSTQWTQPSNDGTNLVRLDPTGGRSTPTKRQTSLQRADKSTQLANGRAQSLPRSRASLTSDQQQRSYTSQVSLSRDTIDYSPAPSYSPPRSQRLKTPTPPSSIQNVATFKPPKSSSRASSLSGSHTQQEPQPSLVMAPDQFSMTESYVANQHQFNGKPTPAIRHQPERGKLAHTAKSNFVEPNSTPEVYNFKLPPVEPPPELSYQYSNIRFDPHGGLDGPRQSELSQQQQSTSQLYAAKPARVGTKGDLLLNGGSSSSALYSNQTFEESTNSYLETYNLYNDDYGQNLLQNQLNNPDQISVVLTERSSITDSIVNTRVTESHLEYQLVTPRIQLASNQNDFHIPTHQRAASDVGLGGGNNVQRSSHGLNLMETSFDLDLDSSSPAPPPLYRLMGANTFGGSQPLSPAPFAGGRLPPQADSKSGSRVYLETSFE